MKIYFEIGIGAGASATLNLPDHKERLIREIGVVAFEGGISWSGFLYRGTAQNPISVFSCYQNTVKISGNEVCSNITVYIYNASAGVQTFIGYLELSDTLINKYRVI